MTKIDYFQWFSLLLCIAIILAMVFTRSINVTGLAVLLVGIYFFSNKFGVNSIFVKIAMGMIVFVITISVISFFFSAEIKLPEFGKNLLLSNAYLTSNPTPIDVKRITTPDSSRYTYAFSLYLKTAATAEVADTEKTYIFYRKDDAQPSSMNYNYTDDKTPNSHGRNIGLRFGNTFNNFRTLYLDYAVKPLESPTTAFYTTEVYSNFPNKQWMDIVISVDKNIINVYIDGKKITKQIYASNLKAPSILKPIEFGTMDAYLANFYHSPETIKPTQSLIEYLSKVDGIIVVE